jgi:hypothetical protein
MNQDTKTISSVEFQIISPPDGNGVMLEFLDEDEIAFMEVNIDSNGIRHLLVYESQQRISIPLSELQKGIRIAEKKVVNIDPDALFGRDEN